MDKQKKIIISHPTGNMNTRAAVAGFYSAQMLESFHTCIACFKTTLLYRLSKWSIFKEFRKREFDVSLKSCTYTYPLKEIGRQIAIKLKLSLWIKHEVGYFCIDKVYQNLDACIANYLQKNNEKITGIYGYEDCCILTFQEAKRYPKVCLYELLTIYWRTMQQLLNEEQIKNPEWAITLGTFNDSKEKLQRKDRELALADKIYVASTFTKNTLKLYPGKLGEIEVIPYGFPTINKKRIYKPFEGRKIKMLFVGGLSQGKGLSYLFDALKNFEHKIELTVVGKGAIDKCPALKTALKTVNYIPSLPHDEVLQLMAQQDLFVFPSLFEGFGLVITEAMSQGTPVITTDRTCGPDIITHGKDGWIVQAGQTGPIKKLFQEFINNPYLLQDAGKQALKTASKRPWSQYEADLSASVNIFLNREN